MVMLTYVGKYGYVKQSLWMSRIKGIVAIGAGNYMQVDLKEN